ncbi:MAG: SBBP repeat-containing protein [Fimbriimonadales bacterium]
MKTTLRRRAIRRHRWARAIAVDNEGNVYVTGESHGGSGGQGGLYDIATVKYSTNGDLLWACDSTTTARRISVWTSR